MSYPENGYKLPFTESLYELKPPTCKAYEPNFLHIFNFIQDGNLNVQNDVLSPNGDVVAGVWPGELVFGFKKYIPDHPSNAAELSILVKNPDRKPEQEGLIGIRNGLVCTACGCLCR